MAVAVMLAASALLAAPGAAADDDTTVEPDPIFWVYDRGTGPVAFADSDDTTVEPDPIFWVYDVGVDAEDLPPMWIPEDDDTTANGLEISVR